MLKLSTFSQNMPTLLMTTTITWIDNSIVSWGNCKHEFRFEKFSTLWHLGEELASATANLTDVIAKDKG